MDCGVELGVGVGAGAGPKKRLLLQPKRAAPATLYLFTVPVFVYRNEIKNYNSRQLVTKSDGKIEHR